MGATEFHKSHKEKASQKIFYLKIIWNQQGVEQRRLRSKIHFEHPDFLIANVFAKVDLNAMKPKS